MDIYKLKYFNEKHNRQIEQVELLVNNLPIELINNINAFSGYCGHDKKCIKKCHFCNKSLCPACNDIYETFAIKCKCVNDSKCEECDDFLNDFGCERVNHICFDCCFDHFEDTRDFLNWFKPSNKVFSAITTICQNISFREGMFNEHYLKLFDWLPATIEDNDNKPIFKQLCLKYFKENDNEYFDL